MRVGILALIFAGCLGSDDDAPRLSLSGTMRFDPDASAGFAPEPRFRRGGDTLVFHDYFAFSAQQDLEIKAEFSRDTLDLEYAPKSDAVIDWSPTVGAETRILLQSNRDSLWVQFPAVTHARPPSAQEMGFRDARERLVFRIGMRR